MHPVVTRIRMPAGGANPACCSHRPRNRTQADTAGAISDTAPDTLQYYDKLGQRVAAQRTSAEVNVYRLDASGMLIEGGELRSPTESYSYDEAGRRISSDDGTGPDNQIRHDARGKVIATREVLANGGVRNQTDYLYDALNRKVEEHDAKGKSLFHFPLRHPLLRKSRRSRRGDLLFGEAKRRVAPAARPDLHPRRADRIEPPQKRRTEEQQTYARSVFSIASAAFNASAAIVSVGLPVATVGNTPLPTRNRLG